MSWMDERDAEEAMFNSKAGLDTPPDAETLAWDGYMADQHWFEHHSVDPDPSATTVWVLVVVEHDNITVHSEVWLTREDAESDLYARWVPAYDRHNGLVDGNVIDWLNDGEIVTVSLTEHHLIIPTEGENT